MTPLAKNLLKRYLVFLLGLAIVALGVAFSIKADLGTSPITSLPYAASELWPVSVGTATVTMHVAFILDQFAILRRRFQLVQLLQLPVGLVFGVLIDGSLALVAGWSCGTYALKLVACAIGIVLVAIGVWLEVMADVVVLAGEGMVVALSRVLPVKFGYLKVAFDVALVLSAAVLSYCGLGHVVGIREGTLAAALLTGLIVRTLDRLVPLKSLLKLGIEG